MNLSTRITVANGLYALLAVVTIADVTMYSYLKVLTHQSATDSTPFVRNISGAAASLRPHGYSDAGVEVPAASSSDKGWAVRYTSLGCKFSRADEPMWRVLKSALVSGGYHIYDVAPYPLKRLPAPAGDQHESQIAFIDVGWMKQYRLTGTPTTLIFNSHGRIIWTHSGTMDTEDQKSALQTISWNKWRSQ